MPTPPPGLGSPDPDLATSDDLPIPGLYLGPGMRLSATPYGGHIYSTIPCADLVTVLAAGEWHLAVNMPIPALDRKPESPPAGYWVMLENGPQTLFAQLSGDPYCSGVVTRSSEQSVSADGVQDAEGLAEVSQERCLAAQGRAELQALYWGPGDLRATLALPVPLAIGRHPISPGDYELEMARSRLTRADLYRGMLRQMSEPSPSPGLEFKGVEFGPDEESTAFVTVTSVDPLVAVVELNDLRDEDGRAQSFRAGIRCDLAEQQLTAAAAATPPPTPTPSPAPLGGTIRLVVKSGPVAGTYEADSAEDVTCTSGLFQKGQYLIQFAPAAEDAKPSFLQLAMVMPAGGEGAAPFRLSVTFPAESADEFGEFYSVSTLDSPAQGSGTLKVTKVGSGSGIRISGAVRTRDGIQMDLTIACREVDAF